MHNTTEIFSTNKMSENSAHQWFLHIFKCNDIGGQRSFSWPLLLLQQWHNKCYFSYSPAYGLWWPSFLFVLSSERVFPKSKCSSPIGKLGKCAQTMVKFQNESLSNQEITIQECACNSNSILLYICTTATN